MDTGRIRMEDYKGVLYCEAYMRDEFSLADLEAMRVAIRTNYSGRADIILKKCSAYSVALDAQMALQSGVAELRNFVYVADTRTKKASAEYAAKSYMVPYNTRVAGTKEEAYHLLCAPSPK